MEQDQEKYSPKKNLTSEYIPPKKKIITSYDKNNEAYYSELNSREQTLQQSNDYYELLKQQIRYYKELNSSLKDEIETVKRCKNLKEQSNNTINNNNEFDQELKLKDLQKEPNLNLIDTLNQNLEQEKNKELFLTESKNSNSEEQWVIVKKEMKRLEDENEFLKSSVEKLNDTIKNMKYPDEENNSYINNNNISISVNNNKEEAINNDDINFQNKLLLDNKRLQIYIEKIEQMQNLLIRYESQINSLNNELKQKDGKMKGIITNKFNSPNKGDKNENLNEDDIVNIKLIHDNNNNNNINEIENGNNELNKQLEQLNEILKENEKLKSENEKLNNELNKNLNQENNNKDISIKDPKIEENEKIINDLKQKNSEYENEIKNLKDKIKEEKPEIEIKLPEDNQIEEYKNKIKELSRNNENNTNKIKE